MFQLRLTSAFIAAGAFAGLASPAFAIVSLNNYARHRMPTYTVPTPAPKMHVGGGHSSGCCNGSGGSHAGSSYGGHSIWTKPRLGSHAKGLHFYGMGGGSIKIGAFLRGRLGGHGTGYGTGGSYGYGSGTHMPSGTHAMGMHYYGMGGGSLAVKYGRLVRDFGSPLHYAGYNASSGWGYNHSGYGHSGYGHWGYGSGTPTTPTYPVTTNPSSGGSGYWGSRAHRSRVHVVVRVSIKERFTSKFAYGSKARSSHPSSGHWGSY